LNAVIALILRFFSRNSTDFQANYITVVEDRPIMSVKYCLPYQASTFGENYNARCSAVSRRQLSILFYTIRKIIYPSFLRRRMVGGERPLLPKTLDQLTPVLAKSPIFNRFSSLFCVFSPNLTDFQANYITVVEDGPLIGENYNAHCSAGFLR